MKNKGKQLSANASWMIFQQIYYMVLSLVVGALSARYLGPSNYGVLNYSSSILSFFTIISKLGLDAIVISEMIKNPEKQGSYLGSALIARLLVSILSVGLVTVIVRILEPDNELLHLVTFLQSISIVMQSYEVFTYWFQMKLQMKYVSIATMVAQTIVAIWRTGLLIAKAPVSLFALSTSIQFLICYIVVIFYFFREKNIKLQFSKADAQYLISRSYHFIISGVAIVFYMQIDKIMIGKFLNEELVGIYSAATVIAAMWEFVPNAIINSARPLIMEQKNINEKTYMCQFKVLLLGVSILGIVAGVGITLLGKLAITILYGEQYLGAVAPLNILIWSTSVAMIGNARGIWIVSEGLNSQNKYCILIGAVVNFALNIFFIQKWGIFGAAISTLISQIVVEFIAPLLFSQMRCFVSIYFSSFALFPDMMRKIKNRVIGI